MILIMNVLCQDLVGVMPVLYVRILTGDPAQRLGLPLGGAVLACPVACGCCRRPRRMAHRHPVHDGKPAGSS